MDQYFSVAESGLGYAVVLLAVLWMLYRTYQVLSKPVDELTSLLGLELPAPPTIALAGLKSDGIILHWKPADSKATISKHQLYINGIYIGDLAPTEPAVAVTGLNPDTGYIIRVRAISQANFEVASEPIRLRTKPATANDFFHAHLGLQDVESESRDAFIPAIVPYGTLQDSAATPPPATPMAREHSGSVSQKRTAAAKRQSPALGDQQKEDNIGAPEAEGLLRSLTDSLDKLRDETERVSKQIEDEEEDFRKGQEKLVKARDSLRSAVNEKESASRHLRSQVTKLEREERAASNKRTALEKQLQQKQDERERMQRDVMKWDQEIEDLRVDSDQLDVRRRAYQQETEEKIRELREQHAATIDAHQAVEDAIKLKKSEIKQLEDEKQQRAHLTNAAAEQYFTIEEDQRWHQRLNELQMQYNEAWQALEIAKRQHYDAQVLLQFWEQRHQNEPHMFVPSPTLEVMPARRPSQRRPRAPSLRNELSPQATSFAMTSSPSLISGVPSMSPSYPPVSSFFNMANGTVVAPINPLTYLSPSEVEQLTGGAPTSPNAGNFLPSDLLSDDTEPSKERVSSSPLENNVLPGLGAPQALEQAFQGPGSPASVPSRSPSVFASPRESQTNLSFFPGGDVLPDSDRRSIRSNTGSGRAISLGSGNTTSRFTSLFGFNRQRGKTFSDEGPALGSLKPAESQSFPRKEASDQDQGAIRRRGSHSGGSWIDMLHRGTSSGTDTNLASTTRRRFNMFGSKTENWPASIYERSSSPRPKSTASSETNLLPRPSSETQSRFGWPVHGDAVPARHSPLATDWGVTVTNSWSRHPSRRASAQYGSSLSLGLEAAISEADDTGLRNGSDFDTSSEHDPAMQAPIGTRPKSSASTAAKLNPAAPSFKILFSRDKRSDETEKPAKEKKEKEKKEKKGKEKIKDKSTAPETSLDGASKDSSPPYGRKSKDAPSVSTTGDTASEPRDSLERSISRTPSEATSLANAGSIPKESFMQRLSRKSSSTILPFTSRSKDSKGSGRFSKKGGKSAEHGTPDETDEEGNSSLVLTKSTELDKAGGSASPFGGASERQSMDEKKRGFSFRSLTGRGGKKERTPSLHESLASETGDEMEESLYEES